MDKAIPRLLSFPPQSQSAAPLDEAEYEKQIRDVLKLLATISAKEFVQLIDGKSVLDFFDPSVNSLPYLYGLLAGISADRGQEVYSSSPEIWANIEKFVTSFDPVQVRYAGHQWRRLVEEVLLAGEKSQDAGLTLKALTLTQLAMLRLDPSTSTFTTTHLDLVKVCLKKKQFESCIPILDNDIFHFPVKSETNKHIPKPAGRHISSSTYITTSSGFSKELTYRDHLQYFLLGAMVYCNQKNWSRAFLFLELTMVSPVAGNTASMIQVEAYKKWLMVGILLDGKPPSMPRIVSPTTSKWLNSLCKPYTTLAEAFKERSPRRLLGEYRAGLDDKIWTADNNHGLVKLVVASHRRLQILSFSKIYSSIPVTTLARLISEQQTPKPEDPVAVEQDIRDAVASKSIYASLVSGGSGSSSSSSGEGTVLLKFLSPDGNVPSTDAQQIARLRNSVSKVDTLNVHIQDSQRRLELTKDYIVAAQKRLAKDKAQRNQDALDDAGASMIGAMDEDTLADM